MSIPPTEPSDSKPPFAFEHATLGSFVADDDVWTTKVAVGNSTLELSLAGTASAPHEALITAATALIARFSEVKETTLAFLTSQDEAPERDDFICQGMELLREDYPNHFSLSFVLYGDDGGVWRVEFEDGEPLFLTRDD